MTADDGSQLVAAGGGANSISIGNGANARGNSAIALGDGAVVMNDATAANPITNNGIAIGTGSRTVSETVRLLVMEPESAVAVQVRRPSGTRQSTGLRCPRGRFRCRGDV